MLSALTRRTPLRPSRLGATAVALQRHARPPWAARASSTLTHIDASGDATMVDVSAKSDTARKAIACATVRLGPAAFGALAEGANAKGNVLAAARIAGIMAAKRTADLIPLCHPLSLSHISVAMTEDPAAHELHIEASASCRGATGVEMEVLTASSVAALTVYDMCKAASKSIVISDIRLLEKSGGKGGTYKA